MPKKHLSVLCVLFAFSLAVIFVTQAAAQKAARWEGKVIRSNKDNQTLTVRNSELNAEKTIKYDSSTKWVSQYHASKKVTNIDASEVKDGDYVICKGTEPQTGELLATVISKRLSHSPQ